MNNIFQFICELLGLYLLFVIFRTVIIKTFGIKALGAKISQESLRALKRYKNRFTFIFGVLSVLFTVGFWFLFKQLIQYFHRGNEGITLTIESFALVLPALLLALLVANSFGKWINDKLQRDGLGFFFEGYEEELKGFDRTRLKKWQIGLTVILVSAILIGGYNYYIIATVDGVKLSTGVFEPEKEFKKGQVNILAKGEKVFLLLDSDTLNLNAFTGNKEAFKALLK